MRTRLLVHTLASCTVNKFPQSYIPYQKGTLGLAMYVLFAAKRCLESCGCRSVRGRWPICHVHRPLDRTGKSKA